MGTLAFGLFRTETLLIPWQKLRASRSLRRFGWAAKDAVGIAAFPRLIAKATGSSPAQVMEYCHEAVDVREALSDRWRVESGFTLGPYGWAMAGALYVILRCTRPLLTVETGVWRGVSSAFMLSALRKNGVGRLHSIDLPTYSPIGRVNADGRRDAAFVAGPTQVGDLVDPELRGQWSLRLGDAKALLPALLDELGTIDAFFHDSEHSYPHMMFEYERAWEHLRPGGWLMTDDVSWSTETRAAWRDFTDRVGGRSYRYFAYDGNRGLIQRS